MITGSGSPNNSTSSNSSNSAAPPKSDVNSTDGENRSNRSERPLNPNSFGAKVRHFFSSIAHFNPLKCCRSGDVSLQVIDTSSKQPPKPRLSSTLKNTLPESGDLTTSASTTTATKSAPTVGASSSIGFTASETPEITEFITSLPSESDKIANSIEEHGYYEIKLPEAFITEAVSLVNNEKGGDHAGSTSDANINIYLQKPDLQASIKSTVTQVLEKLNLHTNGFDLQGLYPSIRVSNEPPAPHIHQDADPVAMTFIATLGDGKTTQFVDKSNNKHLQLINQPGTYTKTITEKRDGTTQTTIQKGSVAPTFQPGPGFDPDKDFNDAKPNSLLIFIGKAYGEDQARADGIGLIHRSPPQSEGDTPRIILQLRAQYSELAPEKKK